MIADRDSNLPSHPVQPVAEARPVLHYAPPSSSELGNSDRWLIALSCLVGGCIFWIPPVTQLFSIVFGIVILGDRKATEGQRNAAITGIICACIGGLAWVPDLLQQLGIW